MKIGFVTDKEEYRIFLGISLHLIHPKLADVLETQRICQIEDK